MITVGKTKLRDKKGVERVYKYSDVPKDLEGWVYDLQYYPIAFDLMHLRFKGKDKVKSGWWNGRKWEGPRFAREIITGWKRNQDHD